jgi:hypothetical protein
MASHKKDLEDWKEELLEGLDKGLWSFADAIANFLDPLSDKIIQFPEEYFTLKKKDRAARGAVSGKIIPGFIENLKEGDVVFAQRMMYRHYGIYAGKKKVIHYAKKESPVRPETAIEETSLGEFSKGDPVYVIEFPKKVGFQYTPRETVRRAKSLIGRTDYNLVCNNCEHFAYWCKTGKHESSQVKDVCERLFNKRFELDELRGEIADKAVWAVGDFIDGIGGKLADVMERLAGVPWSG